MKVSLERSIGIPTVPFAPLKVTVSLEGDVESPSDIEKLSEKLDSIMAIEIMKTLDESVTITDVGYKKYLEGLKNMYNDIVNELEK
jgi:hypothetical protein